MNKLVAVMAILCLAASIPVIDPDGVVPESTETESDLIEAAAGSYLTVAMPADDTRYDDLIESAWTGAIHSDYGSDPATLGNQVPNTTNYTTQDKQTNEDDAAQIHQTKKLVKDLRVEDGDLLPPRAFEGAMCRWKHATCTGGQPAGISKNGQWAGIDIKMEDCADLCSNYLRDKKGQPRGQVWNPRQPVLGELSGCCDWAPTPDPQDIGDMTGICLITVGGTITDSNATTTQYACGMADEEAAA